MLNSKELLILKENNRFEAKKLENNLPRSIWETYSAFANASGGVIFLGVSDVHNMREDFWNLIDNRTKISANKNTHYVIHR